MMKAKTCLPYGAIALGLLCSVAQAERFDLETAIIESGTSKAVGGGKKSGDISAFFTAQKEMVYGALSDLGIALDSLPLEVRRNLERFQTTNFAAFKMFSLGLNAQDEGKFAEAKAFFEKAVEIDPNFELAGQLGISMPNSNVTGVVQLQAALAAAAKSATSSGKTQVEVDLPGAIAALQSGQNVVVGVKADASPSAAKGVNDNLANPAGSASNYAVRKVVGVSYVSQPPAGVSVSVATTNEWTLDQASTDSAGLVKVGDAAKFQATRSNATDTARPPLTLPDGSAVSWGAWQSSAGNYTVSANGTAVANLGPQFQYMIGEATGIMPTTGTATFTPVGGFLTNVTGNIGVDFVNARVQVNALGFDLAGLTFSQLNSTAVDYSKTIASGFFKGNFNSGACPKCTAFSPDASAFTGNFLGKGANGLMFSTIMSTGTGTVSGTHVFGKAP